MSSSETPSAENPSEGEAPTAEGIPSTTTSLDEGIRQVPTVIRVTEPPASRDARDALLQAIATAAERAGAENAGQAAGALLELARAYAIVTSTARDSITAAAASHAPIAARSATADSQYWKIEIWEQDVAPEDLLGTQLVSIDEYRRSNEIKTKPLSQ